MAPAPARPGTLDPAAVGKELLATALVLAALTVTLVGFRIVDATGEMPFQLRFADVAAAVGIGVVGRAWLILLREHRPRPVALFAGAATAFLLAALLGETLFGANAFSTGMKSVVPFESTVVQWLVALAALGFAVRGLADLRSPGRGAAPAPGRGGRTTRLGLAVKENARFIGPLLILFAVILPFLPMTDRRVMDIAILVLTYIMLGWGLNIVVGLAGLLDLGYVAFYAVGAYAYALLAVDHGVGFWLALPLAGFFAALAGVVLGFPVLRLRGDYFAIVTLGFGEMVRIVLQNWQSVTGGPDGVSGIPPASFFGLSFDVSMNADLQRTTEFHEFFDRAFSAMDKDIFLYFLILVLALVTNLFTLRIRRLPVGRAWEALREDEIASRSLGINPTNTKLTAFGISAMFGGFAGTFFATRQGFVSPESFVFIESAVILAVVVLGGFGSQLGIVIAAFVLVGLPEIFRELQDFRMLFFGASMILIMLWRPRGLLAYREPTIRLGPRVGAPRSGDPGAGT